MKVATLLSLGAVALAAPTSEQQTNLPLSRKRHEITRADGSADVENYLSTLKYTLLKYNKNYPLGSILEKSGLSLKKRALEPLVDNTEGNLDELYYGNGNIRKLVFQFDFDTGSSDTFVPGPNCTAADGCSGKVRYDNKGQDEHNTTSVTYGSGSISGENYFDNVTVAGLTAVHQNVISLTTAQGFSGTGADALMGMAFQSIAQSGQPPPFFTLISEGKCPASEFAFYLGREKSGTAGASQMALCGRNTNKFYGGITQVPVTSQTYWQVAIGGASVNGGMVLPTTEGQAAIDTGTTLIIAPTAAATSIFAQIPGSVPILLSAGVPPIYGFAYNCSTSPMVSLSFANKLFAVNPLDFNFGTLSSDLGVNSTALNGLCLAGIAGADLDPTEELWVVGDTFIKNWYSIFHYNSPSSAYVGFAKAKGNQ